MTLEFFLPCIPPTVTHHHKRIVKVGEFSRLADKPELVDAKAMLDSLLLPYRPFHPLTGPVWLELEFSWPYRASEPKRNRAKGHLPHTSRPDCSNLGKTIEDRLAKLRFIEEDKNVVALTVRKWWSATPGISVLIMQLEEEAGGRGTKEEGA